MEKTDIFLSVVIPCYNEEKNLQNNVLTSVAEYLDNKSYIYEGIIVDDGSSDESVKLVKDFIKLHPKFILVENSHQGKAFTVITGVLKSRGKYILFSDFDQATPINEVEKLLPHLDKGCEVVIGSRNGERKGAPILRLIMARGFMLLRTVILGLSGIKDTQCGFKAFEQNAAKSIFSRLKLYGQKKKTAKGALVTAGFDVEVLYIAKKLGYKIKEVPVEWHYVETRRVNPLRDSIEGLRDMIKLRGNDIKGFYGKE